MATMYDVPAEALIEAVADELEARLDKPEWVDLSKSGVDRELPPTQEDFWWIRSASILRKVADSGPVGVERLSTEYGGSKPGSNRYRVAKNHRADGSRKLIRSALQQLESEGLVEVAEGEGRIITADGQRLLDETAEELIDELDRPELERYS